MATEKKSPCKTKPPKKSVNEIDGEIRLFEQRIKVFDKLARELAKATGPETGITGQTKMK